jgi:hypothetical protein
MRLERRTERAAGLANEIAQLVLNISRRNEPANQILDRNNAAKISVSIHDSCQAKPRSAQLLHNAIGGLIVRSGYDTPHIIAKQFVSISVEQNIDDID